MNVFVWVLQVLLALHTIVGALWKFKNSAGETMPTLKAIPQGAWLTLSVFEILCALALVLPAVYKPSGFLAPLAALAIAAEMLLFTGLHFASGSREFGPVIYWLVVAALCGFVACVRLAL
ncbi:MAG TPA: DoxX family protein [Oligoflexus sp.]|uniref:DoxX family protein n=1 Tax=Oligoflexus sp. TaxID=1971216 RepID=UPI002D8006BC|nr:DoxX family protein [Oligoflexus sp.]HET9236350.1 DoxX family protein [Oligoflexus sp.]